MSQAMAVVTQQAAHQAYLLASIEIFRVSAWLLVLLIPCVWFTRRTMANGEVAAAN